MSKKTKALLIISSIALTLILSGSITWLIYGRNTVESASQSDNAVLTNKTTESISEDLNICLQTEAEKIATTIAENIITTEAIEAIPVQSVEAAAPDHDPDVVIAENKPKPVTAKAPEKSTTVDAPPSADPVPEKLTDQPSEKADSDFFDSDYPVDNLGIDSAYLVADMINILDNDHPTEDCTTQKRPPHNKKNTQSGGHKMRM